MTLKIQCAHCSASLRVPETMAGKRGTCPKCGQSLQVPQASAVVAAAPVAATAGATTRQTPATQATAAQQAKSAGSAAGTANKQQFAIPTDLPKRAQTILGQFTGPIEPAPIPWSYRFGIVLVTAVMVILPLLYVGLIALVGYGVYYHAVYNTGIMGAAGGGRAVFFAFLVYLAPILVGGILIAFMVKPLFARPAKHSRPRSLNPDDEKLLFAFVNRICETVGSAKPSRIDLDCDVNASASFRRGFVSFIGNDLVLTIGMPLVGGLTLHQFGGVLAHEFGHFSQGVGMRLTYVIRSIAHWFQRVVYERDQWDEWLHESARGVDLRIGWVLYLSQLMVWVTRKILFVLMLIAHVVAGFMLRQMEFDADRYEARVAGSDTFESTCRRLTVLGVATRGAHADLGEFFQEGRLANDLPRLILANVEQIPGKLERRLNKMIDESTSSWFDTHPSDHDRIESAQREQAPGVFRLDWPASALFGDFETMSKQVTWDFYRQIFGKYIDNSKLHSVDELLARQQKDQGAGKALNRYLQGEYRGLRPIPLPNQLPIPKEPAKLAAEVKQYRKAMLETLPNYQRLGDEFSKRLGQVAECQRVEQLLSAGLSVKKSDVECPVNKPQLVAFQAAAEHKLRGIEKEMETWEKLAGTRLAAALSLACHPDISARLPEGEHTAPTIHRLTPIHNRLDDLIGSRIQMHMKLTRVITLAQFLEGHNEDERFVERLLESMKILMSHANLLRNSFKDYDYPFEHADETISIAKYLGADPLLEERNLGEIAETSENHLDKLSSIGGRAMAKLCEIGEQVETALGLAQLPDVEDDDDDDDDDM